MSARRAARSAQVTTPAAVVTSAGGSRRRLRRACAECGSSIPPDAYAGPWCAQCAPARAAVLVAVVPLEDTPGARYLDDDA